MKFCLAKLDLNAAASLSSCDILRVTRLEDYQIGNPRPARLASVMQRGHIERIDAGLRGVRGAQDVIAAISSRRTVSKLILGHNELGDDGCTLLFRFLASSAGKRYRIREISLNANRIGDAGLLAISTYLLNNMDLKELFLQNVGQVLACQVVLTISSRMPSLETPSPFLHLQRVSIPLA